MEGTLYDQVLPWGKYAKLTLVDPLKNISRVSIALGFMHLISNGLKKLYQLIDLDCCFVINVCIVYIFCKDAQQFDFLKCNLIAKSVYKIKYIIHINT